MTDKWVTCPDCFGTKTLSVILGDGTEMVIDCAGCAPGLNEPRGVIKSYDYEPIVESKTVTGLSIDGEEIEYHFHLAGSCYTVAKSEDIFASKGEAEERAEVLFEECRRNQENSLQRKEKPTRDWAWHVHYYRQQIRRAKQDIERAEAKLNVAIQKSERKPK